MFELLSLKSSSSSENCSWLRAHVVRLLSEEPSSLLRGARETACRPSLLLLLAVAGDEIPAAPSAESDISLLEELKSVSSELSSVV
jgi:hypothetical protein